MLSEGHMSYIDVHPRVWALDSSTPFGRRTGLSVSLWFHETHAHVVVPAERERGRADHDAMRPHMLPSCLWNVSGLKKCGIFLTSGRVHGRSTTWLQHPRCKCNEGSLVCIGQAQTFQSQSIVTLTLTRLCLITRCVGQQQGQARLTSTRYKV